MTQSKVSGAPTIASLDPDFAVVTWEGIVKIHGSGFDDRSLTLFAHTTPKTNYKSDTLLEVEVGQDITGTIGSKKVQVRTGQGDVSNEVDFLVVPG